MRLPANSNNLKQCQQLLEAGEIVAVPSETVYGLAGNALDEAAVRRIFSVKGRPLIDPLICHFASMEAIRKVVSVPTEMELLAEAFWPGALTIVTHKQNKIPDIVTAGLPSAAVRMPSQPTFRSLLQSLDFPLAAPSANPFGYVSPTSANHVEQTLGNKVPAILDDGHCQIGIESTILDLREPSQPVILRYGPIQPEEIQSILKTTIKDAVHTPSVRAQNPHYNQVAPGRLSQHYSPNTEVELIQNGSTSNLPVHTDIAIVINKRLNSSATVPNLYWLSEDGNLPTIAHNLFETLQKLDQLGYAKMIVEKCPDQGLGRAINDRLERAAYKRNSAYSR